MLWREYFTFFSNLSQYLLLQFKEGSRELFNNDDIGLWVSIAIMQTKQCSATKSKQIIPTLELKKRNVQGRRWTIQQRSQNQDTKLSVKIVFFKCYLNEITRCTVLMRILSLCLKRALWRMPVPTTTVESVVNTEDRSPAPLLTATAAAAVQRECQQQWRRARLLRRIVRLRRRWPRPSPSKEYTNNDGVERGRYGG